MQTWQDVASLDRRKKPVSFFFLDVTVGRKIKKDEKKKKLIEKKD